MFINSRLTKLANADIRCICCLFASIPFSEQLTLLFRDILYYFSFGSLCWQCFRPTWPLTWSNLSWIDDAKIVSANDEQRRRRKKLQNSPSCCSCPLTVTTSFNMDIPIRKHVCKLRIMLTVNTWDSSLHCKSMGAKSGRQINGKKENRCRI